MSRDDAHVLDMVRAAKTIVRFVDGFDKVAFFDDAKTQSAVLHQLLVMGEAATRLSEQFRDRVDDVPWRLIVGMRNRLIHGYDEVDLVQVWQTVSCDLPNLLVTLDRFVPKSDEEI